MTEFQDLLQESGCETVQPASKPTPDAYQKNDENTAFSDTNREARRDALGKVERLGTPIERRVSGLERWKDGFYDV